MDGDETATDLLPEPVQVEVHHTSDAAAGLAHRAMLDDALAPILVRLDALDGRANDILSRLEEAPDAPVESAEGAAGDVLGTPEAVVIPEPEPDATPREPAAKRRGYGRRR